MTDELTPLSKKHQVVLDNYLISFHQTRAYMVAYPSASETSARTAAARLFADGNFSRHLQARLAEVHMSADEALEILAAHARGDIGQFSDRLGQLDLQAAKEAGISRLIKKFKQKTVTKIGKGDTDDDTKIHDVEIEIYDAQSAAEKILRIHGKFVDRQDITSNGQTINVTIKGIDD